MELLFLLLAEIFHTHLLQRETKVFFLPKAALGIAAWVSEKDPVMVERKMLKVKHRLNVTCYTIGKVFL